MISEWSWRMALETAIWAYGLIAGSFVYMILRSWWQRRLQLRLAAAADQVRKVSQPLEPGDTVLYGRVDERDGDAVRFEIEQIGHEHTDSEGSDRVGWTEVDRRLEARPFYLIRANGERVRVEPGPRPELVANPVLRRTAEDRRTHTSSLAAGQPVYVTGRLRRGPDPRAGGYREPGERLILTAPAGGPMRISTLPDEHHEKAASHRRWIIGLAVVLGLSQLPYLGYHLRTIAGRVVTARVTSLYDLEKEDDEGHRSVTHRIVADWNGARLEDELPRQIKDSLKFGDEVPFVVVGTSLAQLGDRPFADGGPVVFFLFVPVTAFLYWRAMRRVPWYRRTRLDESEGGTLKTSEPTWSL